MPSRTLAHYNTYRLERSHSEQVGHHGGESGRQAALCYEAQLQLSQANDIVTLFPVPRWYVQQVRLRLYILYITSIISWRI